MNRKRAPRSFLNPSSRISGPVTVRSLVCLHVDTPIRVAKFCPNLLRGLQLCPYTVRLIVRGSHADPGSRLVKVLRGSGCLDLLWGGPRLRPSISSWLQGEEFRWQTSESLWGSGQELGLGLRMLLPLSYSDLDQLGFPSSPALESTPGSIDSLKVGSAPRGVAISHVPRPPALPLVVTV